MSHPETTHDPHCGQIDDHLGPCDHGVPIDPDEPPGPSATEIMDGAIDASVEKIEEE